MLEMYSLYLFFVCVWGGEGGGVAAVTMLTNQLSSMVYVTF